MRSVTEAEAGLRGCRWNYSLPGSRLYRPSELTSWRIDDRFHIDMLVCGGRSTSTFLFYSDPMLVTSASASAPAAADEPMYKEGDL